MSSPLNKPALPAVFGFNLRRLFVAAAISAPLLASASPVNLLTNGSFEDVGMAAGTQGQASGTYGIYTQMPGWSGGQNGIEIRNNVAGVAQDGFNFVELDTTRNSVALQSLNTIAGAIYNLSFYFAPRPNTSNRANDTNNIEVYWNNALLSTVGGTNSTSVHNWVRHDFAVQGTGALVDLKFQASGTSDSYGGSLDNVSLNVVPEPGSIALVLGGLLAAGAATRRRRPL
jgi:hypothetical protein